MVKFDKALVKTNASGTLSVQEQHLYTLLLNRMIEEYHYTKPEDLMLLDLVLHDYIRAKRLLVELKTHGEIDSDGKVSSISNALAKVEVQFRQNLKEMALTPREKLSKMIESDGFDVTRFISGEFKVIDDEGDTGKGKAEKK